MKKKITALLLVCTMAVPYGTMPVYAGALNETEANVSEAYETESAETDAPEETEVYEAESDETEYVLEPEVSDYYAVQASGERTGGNINWNYPDNIIPTDKTTASEGCLLAGVKGTYLADAQNALNLINQYRKEACDNGYPDPRNSGRKLTSSDYKPIKWSSDLEYIARIRAAESSVLISHTRPNGQICFSLSSPNGIGSYGEVLAWNGSNSMLDGIKQWYGEKQYWLDQNSSEETGHYTQMIDPDNNYVGIAAFLNEKGVYYNTTSGEFTTENNLDEETASKVENCIQTIEVKKDELSGSIEGLNANAKVGDTEQAKFKLTYNDCDLQYLSGVTGAAINWSSDNEAIAKVDQNGTVTAVGAGQVTITAETDCGLKASYKITVSENTEKITESDVTVGECIYTGSAIKPSVTVKHSGKTLQEETDYTYSYTKGVQAGDTITVTVEGKGDYSGTVTKTVTIQPKSLDDNTEITIGECDYTDEGAIKEALTVKNDGKTLSKGTDYEIVSLKTTDKGSTIAIAVEIKGTGNYKGTVQKELTVSKKTEKLTESDVTVGECIYTGLAIKPSVTVKHSGKTLQEGTDYTYTYTKGVEAGDTITVTVEGKGDYSGTVTKTVTIQPKSLDDNTEITIGECDYTDEGAIKEALTVKNDGKTLSKGTDYEIVSLKTTDKGSTIAIAVEIKGTGNYKGTVQKELTVSKKTEKLTESDVTVGECIYTGSEIKPSVVVSHNGKTLKEGTDYTYTYTKGVEAGDTITVTVEGKGDYSGTVTKTVTIQAKNLDGNTEIAVGECDYTDEETIKEALTVKSDGKTLSKGNDYEIVSLKTTDKGSTIVIAVEVKGTGNYKGTVQKELTVSKKTEKLAESDVTVGECIYTGSAIKPSIVVSHNGKTLKEGTDYTYTYTKGVQAGDTITVTVEGKGDYSGTVAKTVTIQAKSLEGNTEITIGECDYTDEGAIKEALIVKNDGKTLSKGNDYEIVSLKTTDKGSTIVIAVEVKGTGNYKGTVQKELTVSKKTEKLAESDVTVGECIYTGSAIKPSVVVSHNGKTLKEGTDYTYTYTKGVQAGDTITVTVEGKGDYSGTVTKTVTIQPKSLDDNTEITVGKCDFADIDSVIGAIVVRCDGKTLTRGEDYYVSSCSLSSNGYVAEINVSVEGLGNYCGTVQKDLTVTKDQKPSVYSVSIKCVSDGLSISWQSTDNADGYYIYRSCYRNNKWESWKNIKKITNGDTKTWKDNNTDSSVLYRYTVRAYNSSGMSDYNNSNIAESYFIPKPTTKLSNGAKGISVSWTKSKNASGYYIYRKEKKSDGWTKVKTVDSKASSWMDNSAKSGKSYYYTVVAYRNKTRSAFDTDRMVTRLDMPSVKNTNAAKGIQVKWNKISGTQSYDVYRSQYVNNAWSKWNKIAGVSSNSLSYTDGSVKEGIIYKYTVRAVKGSSMSEYESGTAIRYLSQPDFSLSGTSKGIAIKVKANKNIDGYLIYRKDSNGKWQRMTTVKANKDMTWTDSNVKRNNKYTYTVRAYKKNDLSSYHSGKSVTFKGGK